MDFEYLCYTCQRGFIPVFPDQCHMIPDAKQKHTWNFQCDKCFKGEEPISPEEFRKLLAAKRKEIEEELSGKI